MNGRHNGADERPHIEPRQAEAYIGGCLDEQEREKVEAHLYECDGCLALYMNVLEAGIAFPPAAAEAAMPDMEAVAERIVNRLELELMEQQERAKEPIPEQRTAASEDAGHAKDRTLPNDRTGRETRRRRGKWLQHPATHFAVAAAVTVLLIGTGVLGGFSERLASLERHAAAPLTRLGPDAEPGGEAWSERMLDRTVSWLDGIEAVRFK